MYIVEEGNIAVVTCSTVLDLDTWQELLEQVDELDCPAVVDTRDSSIALSELDAYVLALKARRLQSLASHRTAFVTADSDDSHTAFFANCSRHRGLRIRAFDNPAAATDWALQATLSGAG